MSMRRWATTAFEIFMVATAIVPAMWVSIPQAHASVALTTSDSCPNTDFSINDAQEVVPFWQQGGDSAGVGTMHVTVPGAGKVAITEDGTNPDDGPYWYRTFDTAGTYGIDLRLAPLSDEFVALYQSQQSKTVNYTATFTPVGGVIVTPDLGAEITCTGTQTTSINWVPAKPIASSCVGPGCPATLVTGCYTVEMTCYERTVTLHLTRKTMSGTIDEAGGGHHCWGTNDDPAYVSLWHLAKGKWTRLDAPKATNGEYSAKLFTNSFTTSVMKQGGIFQVAINPGANRGSDYACGAELSNIVKLKPL